MAGLIAQAKAWAYLRNKGKSKVKKQQQIPYGNDKQKGQIRRFWLRQNDDFKWLRQNDDVKQAKSTTEILAAPE
jgi:hypothetical protein